MESAVQTKEGESAAKAVKRASPESAPRAAETGMPLGMPLFLAGGLRTGAPTPRPTSPSPRPVQAQAQDEEEEVIQAKCCDGIGNPPGPLAEEEGRLQRRPSAHDAEGPPLQAIPLARAGLRPQLSVAPADDPYEREADHVAETVMRLPDSSPGPLTRVPGGATLQRLCAECQEERPGTGRVQAKQTEMPVAEAADPLDQTLNHPGSGVSLPAPLQSRIGAVLGRDLSQVRVHSDGRAQDAARSINAKAFTHRNHIYLGRGQSENDMGLMAHEATHVAQQGAAPLARPTAGQPGAGVGADAGATVAENQGVPTIDGSAAALPAETEPARREAQHTQIPSILAGAPAAPAAFASETGAAEPPASGPATPEAEASAALEAEPPAMQTGSGAEDEGAAPGAGGASAGGQGADAGEAQGTSAGSAAEGGAEAQQQGGESAPEAGPQAVGGAGAEPETEEEAQAGSVAETGPEADGADGAAVNGDPYARIAAAPDSEHKAFVLTQAERVNGDCETAAGLLQALAGARRAEVSGRFGAARDGMSGFIEARIEALQAFVAAKQAQIGATIANALATVQGAIAAALISIHRAAASVQESIAGIVQRAGAAAQATVSGIAGRISHLINTLPLPDLPGVEQARRLAASLINHAVAAVNAALGTVLGMIQSALAIGMRLLTTALNSITAFINMALTRIAAALSQIAASVFSLFNRVLSRVVGTLRRILYGTVLPILTRAERRVLRAIRELAQRSLRQIRANCRAHLVALAASLGDGGGQRDGVEATTRAGDWRAHIIEISARAQARNAAIIHSFQEKTRGVVALLLTTLQSVAAQVMAAVTRRIAGFISAAVDYVAKVLLTLRGMVEAVTQFIANTITWAISLFVRVVNYIRSLVERPVQALIAFADNVLSRIRSAVSGMVRRLVSGQGLGLNVGELIGRFRMPPTSNNPTIAFAGPPAGFVIVIFQGVVYIIAFGFAFSLTVAEFIVLIIVIVVIILIILLLLYLLYKWLTRPKPVPKPRPRPRPRGREFHPDTPFNVIRSVPLQKVKLPAAAGDDLVFGVQSRDKDKFRPIGTAAWIPIDPGKGPYETVYEVSQSASWLAPGSGNTTYVHPTLDSRGVRLFIDEDWNGEPITVTATVRDQAPPVTPPDIGTTRDTDHVITWTLDLCQDPLTAATAKHIPSLAPQLNQTNYNSTSLTLLDGSSDTVGASMLTELLTHEKTGGGAPNGQDNLYGLRKLPTLAAHGGSGFKQTQVYIKGHLLNHSDNRGLGGVGDPINLYPITGQANRDHNSQVEENVKDLVHDDKLVVRYGVSVVNQDGPHAIDIFGDGHCTYQYINAGFSCAYATYKYCDGELQQNSNRGGPPVASSFDVSGFIENIRDNKGSCQEG